LFVQNHVNRDDFGRVQQRVASAAQHNDAARVKFGRFLCEWHQFRLHGAQFFGVTRFHQRQVQRCHGFHAQLQAFGLLGNAHTQPVQHAQNLVALLQFQLAHFVVPLHYCNWLDKERRAGSGLVVHDGFDATLKLRAQRQHIAAPALGDDRFLQHAGAVRVVDIAGEPFHQARVADLHFRADASQGFGSAVQHLAAIGDGAGDQVHQTQTVRQTFRQLRHARGICAVVFQDPAGGA